MKLRFLIVGCITTSLISMERPPQLIFSLEDNNSSGKANQKSLQDFIELKDRAGKLCKIVPKTISHEFDVKILRVHSEGEIDKLDCESINNLIRIECSQAADVLTSLGLSRSVMSTTFAQERYDKARERYRNALLHTKIAFGLKCYKTMDKLYQVLSAFTEAERSALQENNKRKFDQQTLELYDPLEEIITKAESKAQKSSPLIPTDNTRQLVKQLEVPESPSAKSLKITALAKKSVENGNSHLKAGRELLKNLQDPTIESYNNIEITFFLALEHFITAYHRDINQGLENAETALLELDNVHTLKKNKFGKEGQRLKLAMEKLRDAQNLNAKSNPNTEIIDLPDEDSSFASKATSQHSHSSNPQALGLREDATEDYRPAKNNSDPTTLATPQSARSEESKLHESEKAVKEKDDKNSQDEIVLLYIPPQSRTAPSQPTSKTTLLSLVKSAWKNCKKAGKGTAKGVKYVWHKLPFNRSDK